MYQWQKTGSLRPTLERREGILSVRVKCDEKCRHMAMSDQGEFNEPAVSVLNVSVETKKKRAWK
jgi:hypothetical protein